MLKVDAIENGTVFDHIKAGKGAKVLRIMGVDENYKFRVALLMNVPSKKMGSKDIVKIAESEVSEDRANLIALISPGATINIIRDGKVARKYTVQLPEELKGTGKCPNPNCITNYEKGAIRMFKKENEKYRCYYCERTFNADELVDV